MTFAAPMFAWAAGVAVLAVVGLHLLAWRRPPETPLPTARFAPERPIRMVSRAIRPADILLLAIRVLVVLFAGFALAGPRFDRARTGSARVVVVDRSNSASSASDVAEAARRELRDGDALIVFDSAAREIASASADSFGGTLSGVRGGLSPGLIAAIRSARRLEQERDTVEIVVVSPFVEGEVDAATATIRSLWSGTIRRVRVAPSAKSSAAASNPELRGDPADGVTAAIALNGAVAGGDRVRLVRDSLLASDSAATRQGRTVVAWPSEGSSTWPRRERTDTAMAVGVSGDAGSRDRSATVVALFARSSRPPEGRVVARWADGEPAATEVSLGAGCIRSVAVDVPSSGDLALTPSFRRFARRMAEPCGAASGVALSDSALDRILPATIAGPQAAGVASVESVAPASRLAAWLLALALAAAVAELFVRRRPDHASA